LLDTNVVLDHLLNRPPWNVDADRIWRAVDDKRLDAVLAAITLTNIAYVARRRIGTPAARAAVQICLDTFEVVPVDGALLRRAVAFGGRDFEDDVQILCALAGGAEAIITRDREGFRASPLPVLSPAAIVQQL
jgi:predicted nucleic acid-binding protein